MRGEGTAEEVSIRELLAVAQSDGLSSMVRVSIRSVSWGMSFYTVIASIDLSLITVPATTINVWLFMRPGAAGLD